MCVCRGGRGGGGQMIMGGVDMGLCGEGCQCGMWRTFNLCDDS